MFPKKPKQPKTPKTKPAYRELTDQEQDAVYEAFLGDIPIVVAILGQCMVEYELDLLIRFTLKKMSNDNWNEMSEGDGPFGTFYRKIMYASAAGIISGATRSKLDKIRTIRNRFAHSKHLVQFNDAEIIRALNGAELTAREIRDGSDYKEMIAEIPSPEFCRTAYQWLCQHATIAIMRRYGRGLRAATINKQRANKRKAVRNPFSASLFGSGSGFQAGRGGGLLAQYIADPTLSGQIDNHVAQHLTPPESDKQELPELR